ncbi:MAG: hypothetical protein FWG19_02100 [Methanomassiliicoccaceae archaeon]|nr:hypothetical protein [Methanomassiliicoccaceae archaeon]
MAKKKKQEDEGTINDVFSNGEEEIPAEMQLFGKNPKRTHLLRDLWYNSMVEELDTEEDMPDNAKKELLFMMVANSVLDLAMESLPDELAVELSYHVDHLMAMAAVNKKYGVDLLEANYEVVSKMNREEYGSDEEFETAVSEKEEKWWTTGKQQLGGRSPNDAVAEELSRYGLNR